MADLIDLYGKGLHQFGLRLHQVGADQWHLPTPCSDWSVRDLAYHVIDEQRWAPPLLAGKTLEEAAEYVAAIQNTDPVGDWDEASGKARAAFAAVGVLEHEVHLSRGPTPATQYLTEMVLDACTHSWDLGAAIGIQPEQPDELVQFALDTAMSWGDLAAFGDFFAKAVEVPTDAPLIDRLVGYSGRSPRWPSES
jgi:uncharacterized protein (TIGR03086 family)